MLKNENIDKLKKEIKQKQSVVFEIDFKNDMDSTKSPQNEIKQDENYWEFVCEKGAEGFFGDFEVICGQLEEKEEYFQGLLEEQPFCENENKSVFEKNFNAILSLRDEYDILNISFAGKAEQRFKISVYNDYQYQAKKDIKKGTLEKSEDNQSSGDIKSPQAQLVNLDLEPRNNLSVAIKNENRLYQYISFEHNFTDTISFYLDYKLNKININSQKWQEVFDVDFADLNHFELQAIFQNDAVSFDNKDFYIYKVMYAKNKGHIYLKPVTLPKGNYKLFLYYTGEVTLEYAQGNSNNWEIFPEKFRLKERETFRLRIKMNSGDKLHDLFIVNCNK